MLNLVDKKILTILRLKNVFILTYGLNIKKFYNLGACPYTLFQTSKVGANCSLSFVGFSGHVTRSVKPLVHNSEKK